MCLLDKQFLEMCGRICLTLGVESLRCACSFKPKNSVVYLKPDWRDEHNDGKSYNPSYNIAPTEVTPVLINTTINNSGRLLKPMMWGMIPPWHKGDHKNHSLSTNNCRIENILTSKLYAPTLRHGRCVVVVEGFYEWQTTNKTSTKQPYFIYAPQKENVKIDEPETWGSKSIESGDIGVNLLYLAAVYSIWQYKGAVIYSYSVVTMESNSTMDWLHHRMPAVLNYQEQFDAWLDVENVNPDMAVSYLKPVTLLCWHPVSTLVNNSRNKTEDCNKRIQIKEITKVAKKELKKGQRPITAFFSVGNKRKAESTQETSKKTKT